MSSLSLRSSVTASSKARANMYCRNSCGRLSRDGGIVGLWRDVSDRLDK